MRRTPRQKYYGRSSVAAALRDAVSTLNNAIDITSQPETILSDSLKKVLASVNRAIEAEKVYILGRKRLRSRLETQKKELEALLKEVMELPVSQVEKILAKRREEK